ncbi:Hypothetical predicted protein [Paramuricea clavata]|uniref:Uncharacterized protein n=1 Tax=Paramuricea clavata TaxID=317549 RepID=A0A7D9E8R0_PARCT|nr:Hypothetical predicted protein [Paramuricea clavata]
MPENINTFVKYKATSVSQHLYQLSPVNNPGYYSLTRAKVTILSENPILPTNMYTIFSKSSAIEHGCLEPMENVLQDNMKGCLLDGPTLSRLVKHLAKNGTGFIVYPELSDVLNELFKSDEEMCSGDNMLLCKLFWGERMSFHYATEETSDIDTKTPFSRIDK